MWIVTTVGMTTPSAARRFSRTLGIGRQTGAQSRPLAATVWFGIDYFIAWVVFVLLATFIQWVFERNTLFHFSMESTNNLSRKFLFLAAGIVMSLP
jgi:predicted metal-binding membrane protein